MSAPVGETVSNDELLKIIQLQDQKINELGRMILALTDSIHFLEQVATGVTEGVERMTQVKGPSAVLLRSLGLPVDQINDHVQIAKERRYR